LSLCCEKLSLSEKTGFSALAGMKSTANRLLLTEFDIILAKIAESGPVVRGFYCEYLDVADFRCKFKVALEICTISIIHAILWYMDSSGNKPALYIKLFVFIY